MDYSRIVTLPGGTKLGLTYDPITNKTLVPDSEIEMLKGTGEVDFRDVITGDDLKRLFGDNVTFVSDEYYSNFLNNLNTPSQMSGVYQTTDPNMLGYSPPNAGITAVPQVQEQTQVVQEADKTLAETLFPQGEFLDIRETATSPTEYNIEATKDLVENLPGIVQPFAPAAAGIMSLPYDAIQAYQRMQSGSGIGGFMKAYQAERPLQSAYERFVGASGPLAENINQAVSTLNPFQQRQYMQYATQNPEQARAAAERSQQFVQARGGNQ